MTTRRSFLQAAAAATMTMTAARANPGPGELPVFCSTPAIPLYRIVADGRFEESTAFGGESARLGNAVRMTNGDVTRLWYEELAPRWRQGPAAIAGLTTHGPLFCLERWAWDHGMRVILRIDHHRKGDGTVRHFIHAEAAGFMNQQLSAAGRAYPLLTARAAQLCASSAYQVVSPEVACDPEDPEPLISWVIAPINRA